VAIVRLAPRLGALALAAGLAACTVGPEYQPDEMALPAGWTESRAAAEAQSIERLKSWWAEFQDPLLDKLVGQAIAGNYDLKIARQRLVQARAERAIAGAADYPQVKAEASRTNSNSSTTVGWPPGIGQYHTWVAGFDASWELDVFGGTARSKEAAEAEIGAAIEDRRAILVSLLAELADAYAGLRVSQLRRSIAEHNIEVAQKAVALTQTQLDRGFGTELDLAQARAQQETVEAGIPQLDAAIARAIHAIALLQGQFPEQLPGDLVTELERPAPLMTVPASLPVTLPSEVVANRPDIRRAERRYAAANARIGVATAAQFPDFSIPLLIEPNSAALHTLFEARSLDWTVGAALSQTVFDGGRIDARIEAAKAAAEQARLGYETSVQGGFREVEDALVNYRTEARRHVTLKAVVADDRKVLDQATRLYGAGLTDFLKVLDAERSAYAADDVEAQSRYAEVTDVIALFKALGGGWQAVPFDDVPVAAKEAEGR